MFGNYQFGAGYFGQVADTPIVVTAAILYYKTRANGSLDTSDAGTGSRTTPGRISRARQGRITRQLIGQEFD